jgi:hypothetical protein
MVYPGEAGPAECPFDKDARKSRYNHPSCQRSCEREPCPAGAQLPTANSEGKADAKVCGEAGVAPSRRPRLVV